MLWALVSAAALALNACVASIAPASVASTSSASPQNVLVDTPTAEGSELLATPQTTATPGTYGPNLDEFPAGINPLTGQPVIDPDLLKIPAVLVSISHFPATVRPQAGLSFAPFVYEFSITGGETRFLAAFYGQFPAPEAPVRGDCTTREGVFKQTRVILGARVWLDTNRNGILDAGEAGIPGICVELKDTLGNLLQKTTTDTNGLYGFNVDPGQSYVLHFLKPATLEFTRPNVGDDNTDSDADPASGETAVISLLKDDISWDAGLFPSQTYGNGSPDALAKPKPEVGPVRSGRLLYAYIGGFYQNSCLIYAFASPEVLEKLPHCAFVPHEALGGGEMLTIARMQAVAKDNMRNTTSRPFNYASNVFSEVPPAGGAPAQQVNVFFGNLDQSGWSYDPLYDAYLRYVDTADPKARGVLHADIDRLTGRQLHFENVIVMMADTDVVTKSNIDIHLDEGNSGPAYLFRNGQAFPIEWSTVAGAYEKRTGFRRPMQFLNQDGSPAALKPGHTWVIIVTPFSIVQTQDYGVYQVRYEAPAGEAR
jgi:hypothetical protein